MTAFPENGHAWTSNGDMSIQAAELRRAQNGFEGYSIPYLR
jgi:hypothetical protein